MVEENKVIIETDVPREKGYIYCVKGNPLTIIRIKAGRKKREVKV